MAESFRRHHPDAALVLVYLGGDPNVGARDLGLPESVEVIAPETLVGHGELERMGLCYSTQGLAGAMKPRVLRYTLERFGGSALFIDCDIYVVGQLLDIAARAEGRGIGLTTHVVRPLREAEGPMLLAGVFNSGFVVVSRGGESFLDWWSARTARDSILNPAKGLLWEQGWLALAPALFDVEVIRDVGVNTMGRELLEDDVAWTDSGPRLAGEPLRCYHFSGPYDPHEPQYVLAPSGAPGPTVTRPWRGFTGALTWLDLGERPGALRMSRQYASELIDAGYGARSEPARFSELDGKLPVHRAIRRAYRAGLMRAEATDGAPEPPNPFLDASSSELISWLLESDNGDPALHRFALGLREAYDGAAEAFPRVPGDDTQAFLGWAADRLRAERQALPRSLRASVRANRPSERTRSSRFRSWRGSRRG